MSKSFTWTPVSPPPPPGGSLDEGIIELLVRHFWDSSVGSVDTGVAHDLDLGESDQDFFRGVLLATTDPDIAEDANDLLAAIRKHGSVRIKVHR